MKKYWVWAWLGLAPLVAGVSCQNRDTYRGGADMQGVVKLGPFPAQGARVGGYNLYLAAAPAGPFKKINDEPISGGSSLMVPYLKPGQTYYFRMTSVGRDNPNLEGRPGAVFKRVAVQSWN